MAKTASFTAKCSSVSNVYQSNWSAWSVTKQGSYDAGEVRLGAFLFSNLRSTVKWAHAKISKITLTLKYDKAGGNREKTLYMYRGTQKSLTGTGNAMKGTAIGTVSTNGKAYDATRTITFDASTNAAAFANLAAWLTDDESLTLVLYRNESSESGTYSANYLQISAATMTVEYSTSPFYVYKDGAWINTETQVYKSDAWVDADATRITS